MDIQKRDSLYEAIVKSEQAGQWGEVVEACVKITQLDLPDLEKCVAWINAGRAYGHLLKIERALECFDKAVRLESRHKRFFALEAKAAFLAEHSRDAESLGIYRELSIREDLYVADQQRILANIKTLQARL